MTKLVWRVKLVTELEAGETTEIEVARIERDEQASLGDLGLRLSEAKRLTASIQAKIVTQRKARRGRIADRPGFDDEGNTVAGQADQERFRVGGGLQPAGMEA